MKRYKIVLYCLMISGLAILAWYKVLGFWFFKGFEPSWLLGRPRPDLWGYFVSLVGGHAFIYLLSFKLFGWNPTGWYLLSLIFHTIASLFTFWLVGAFTKSVRLGFIVALLFVANISYHNVLTWGSFNAHYPLMLICFLLALLFFYYYRESKRKIFYILSLFTCALACPIRESAILIPPIILSFDLTCYWLGKKERNIYFLIRRHLPFFLLILVYLLFRAIFLKQSCDFADEMVNLRVKLVSEHLFGLYLMRSALIFGRHFAAHIIPYLFLNKLSGALVFFPYFYYSFLGWVLLCLLVFIMWIFRREERLFPVLLFALIWIILQTAFISLAMPGIDIVLKRAYEWNTRRYSYYPFFGVALFFGALFYHLYTRAKVKYVTRQRRVSSLFYGGIGFILLVNVVMIHGVENYLSRTIHGPARRFYTTLLTLHPTLPDKCVICAYPAASGLGDYFYEWYWLRGIYYPNLKKEPFRADSQVGRILEKIEKGDFTIDDVFFFDYNPEEGLKDLTQEARDWILNAKEIVIPFQKVVSNFKNLGGGKGSVNIVPPIVISLESKGMPPVEVPYQVEIRMKATPLKQIAFPFRVSKEEVSLKEISPPKEIRKDEVFKALIDYALDRKEFLEETTVEVSATKSSWWPGGSEPFLHFVPENLIDGHWGPRSQWMADSRPAWIILDLHRIKSIGAVIWASESNFKMVPSTYSFFASRDGVDWQRIKQVEKNNDREKIEIFDEPIEARYIKMVIDVTSEGDFALLDELEIVGSQATKIFDFYQDREELIQDSQHLFSYIPSEKELDYALSSGIKWGWGELSWETNTYWDDFCSVNFPYLVDGEYHTYTLWIRETQYSNRSPGEFLMKFLTKIKLDLGEYPAQYEIDYIKLKPKYKIERKG